MLIFVFQSIQIFFSNFHVICSYFHVIFFSEKTEKLIICYFCLNMAIQIVPYKTQIKVLRMIYTSFQISQLYFSLTITLKRISRNKNMLGCKFVLSS